MIANNEANEAEIVHQLRRGTPNAIATVRRRVGRILDSPQLRIPRETRKDLQQEVTTQIWQAVNRKGFDPDRGFWGFVEVVTARRWIDWLRTRKEADGDLLDIPDSRSGPLDRVLDLEQAELARSAVAKLGKPCQDLLRLHFTEGRPYAELAGVLGKTDGALRVQVYRCIRQAQKILARLTSQARQDVRVKER